MGQGEAQGSEHLTSALVTTDAGGGGHTSADLTADISRSVLLLGPGRGLVSLGNLTCFLLPSFL